MEVVEAKALKEEVMQWLSADLSFSNDDQFLEKD